MKLKNNQKKILIIIGIILILIGIIYGFGGFKKTSVIAQQTEYIQAPVFGWYSCEPATRQIRSVSIPIEMYKGLYEDIHCPINTDKCSITIQGAETNILGRRILYRYCPVSGISNCYSEEKIPAGTGRWFVKDGKYHYTFSDQFQPGGAHGLVKYQRCNTVVCIGDAGWFNLPNEAEWYANFNPFIIWFQSSLTGKHEYSTLTQGCTFPSSDTNAVDGNKIPGINTGSQTQLINSVSNLKYNADKVNPISDQSTASYTLEPYKVRNVIVGYVPMSIDNVQFVNWNGKQGYCLNRIIYSIAKITTKDGKALNVVDVNWNNQIADLVKNGKQCCPNENEPFNNRKCGSDFMWHPIEQSECSLMNPCSGDWYPSGNPGELIRYDCDYTTGKCSKKLTKPVECTKNSDCIGNSKGSVCDTLLWECSSISPPITNGTCPLECGKNEDCFNCGEGFKCEGASWLNGFFYKGKCQETKPDKNTCQSCEQFAVSTLFKWTGLAKKCEPKGGSIIIGFLESLFNGLFGKILPENYPQTFTTCSFTFFKFFVSFIILIFGSLFSIDYLNRFKDLKGKKKNILRIFLGIIIGIGLALLSYFIFWLGFIAFIIFIIIRIGIKSIIPT